MLAASLVAMAMIGTGGTAGSEAPRWLALGDSYTVGEAVVVEHRWPIHLASRLVRQPRVTIVARTGWTTDELSEAIDQTALKPPYDLVTLSIGVNNQYRNRALSNYRDEVDALLKRSIALAGGVPNRVVAVSIPDWGQSPFADNDDRGATTIGQQIDAFNAVFRTQAENNGVAFVDITPASRLMAREHADAAFADDGLHPSAAQYSAWVDEIEPVVRARLR